MYAQVQRRDIRLLAALRGASFLGDSVALVALYLRVAPVGHAWAIAALAIAGSLPLVVLAPLAGHVVDRLPAKRSLLVLGLVEALVCVGLGYWHGVGATLALMLALNVAVAFSMPGYGALLPVIAGEENIGRSQGMMQSVQGVASVAGPALGGLLVGWVGQSWPLYIDAVSFCVGALATTLLHHDRRPSARGTIEEIGAEDGMMAGVALIFRDDLLRPLLINVSVFMLSLGMTNVAEVFFITQTLHGSATYYGLVGTSFGLGTIVGSLAAGRLSQAPMNLARALTVSICVVGLSIGAVGLVTRLDYLYPLFIVAGVAVGVANVAALTLFTLRTPEVLRGRMYAALGAVVTASQLGATAAGGAILVALAPRTVFQVSGVVATVTALVLGSFALRASGAAHERERSAQGA